MRATIRLLSLILAVLLAGRGENRRPVIVGLKPSPPQEEGSSVGNSGILFFGLDQWLAYIRVNGEHESVVTRFPDGSVEESEAWDSVTDLAISPDGRTLTYVGTRGGRSRFIVNGEPGPVYANIEGYVRTVFSADGKHWAYVARRDDERSVVVHDGIEDPFEASFSVRPFFSPKSGRLVYFAQEIESRDPLKIKTFVVVDGKAGKAFGGVLGPIQLKPDTDDPIYVGASGPQDKRFVVIGGREGKVYDRVTVPRLSSDGRTVAYLAELDRKTFVVINDREFGPYGCCANELAMDPDGRRIAYSAGEPAQSGQKTVYRLILDGVPSTQTYEHIEKIVLSRPGSSRSRVAFTATRGEWDDYHKAIVVDGIMGAEYKETRDVNFSSSGDIFYVAEEDGKAFPVHEREAGPSFDEIKAFTVSEDGKAIAFIGVRNGKSHLVHWTGAAWKESAPCDGIEPMIDVHGIFVILFDTSGNAVYRASRKGKQFVVVGDKEQTPYDAIHDVRVGLDGRGVLAIASVGNKMFLVLDGREIAEEEGIGDLGTPEKHRKTIWETRVTAGRVQAFVLRDGTSHVQLNDKTIYTFDNPTGGGPGLVFQGKVNEEDALLLTEYHGDGCPEMHRLIAIDRMGEPFVSESFGDCHGDAEAKTFEDRIEMTFPGEPGRDDQRWVYRPGGSFEHQSFKRPGRRNTQDLAKTDATAVSWGPQFDFFMERNFEILSWEDAKQVLERDDLKGGKQYHTGWLTIFLDDERAFLTKPPDINFIFEFAKKHDGFAVE
jgi:hypothetical protein